MNTIKGPAVFLAQFIGDKAPFNSMEGLCKWAASMGYKGIQIPVNHPHLFDVEKAAQSAAYADDFKGIVTSHGLEITELSTHLEGQLIAVHPSYSKAFDAFAPAGVRGNNAARTEWATTKVRQAIQASSRLGLNAQAAFSGALAWPYLYPWPQPPAGLVEEAFAELARRWKPIFDFAYEHGVDIAFELHPGEDLHDGVTFERFLEEVDHHSAANILYDPSHFLLQQMDYLGFIDRYHERIKAFHVKDAEFNPTASAGVYGSFSSWADRPGRFRSLGDGQIDFTGIFSKLTQYGFQGWAVMEWECCLKSSEQGAREGAPFIASHIIEATEQAFDDFAGTGIDRAEVRSMLGLS